MKPDSFFEEYAENAYRYYDIVTGNNLYWKDLESYQQKAWVAAIKSVFRKLEVRDTYMGEPYVSDDWQPEPDVETAAKFVEHKTQNHEMWQKYSEKAKAELDTFHAVGDTLTRSGYLSTPSDDKLADLVKLYTGVLEATHFPKTDTYDFEWKGGNDYVIIYNTFLEDSSSAYARLYDNGKLLTLTGSNHEITLELFEDHPELDVKVFKKIDSKTKIA